MKSWILKILSFGFSLSLIKHIFDLVKKNREQKKAWKSLKNGIKIERELREKFTNDKTKPDNEIIDSITSRWR